MLVALFQTLQPTAARGLPSLPSSSSSLSWTNNNFNDNLTIFASNGSLLQSGKLDDSGMENGEEGAWDRNQQRYILVVVHQSPASASVAELEREFHDFVKLFFLEQFREEDDDVDELHQRIRFRHWRGE